jgi:hypothetical protein
MARREGMREYAIEDRADKKFAEWIRSTPTMTVDMERLAEVWRKMEDKMTAIRKAADAEVAAIKTQQDLVSTTLLKAMQDLKQTKSTTGAGEIVVSQSMKPSAKDWGAVYRFVVENDAFDMLHKRLSSTFIENWAKAHDALPPGISVFTEFKVSVKKPGSKDLPKED